jgi:hypothetical protein
MVVAIARPVARRWLWPDDRVYIGWNHRESTCGDKETICSC